MMNFSVIHQGFSQSIFTAWKSAHEEADEAYREGNYSKAAVLYEDIFKVKPSRETNLSIARSYYAVHHFDRAIRWYEQFIASYGELPVNDLYSVAESFSSLGKYEQAISFYSKVFTQESDNLNVARKMWRLRNRHYLYEDSVHYAVTELAVNSAANDISPVITRNGVIFLSNRDNSSMIKVSDANTQRSFYRLYFAHSSKDSVGNTIGYEAPQFLEKDFGSRFQEGAVALFSRGNKMIYTVSSDKLSRDGGRKLQLWFAEYKDGGWQTISAFPYNSSEYSFSDPAISEDGTTLYFISDMSGGQGGKDIYRSQLKNGKWTKPVNEIDLNTPYEEATLFLHRDRTLYFSSTGHAGLGGRDIFKVEIGRNGYSDVTNVGYPINTHHDDFSFSLDSLGVTGYFSSNRKTGDLDDDLYRVDIGMQPYPLTIEGVIRYKESVQSDSTTLKTLPRARLFLIDNLNNEKVYETISDIAGNFVLQIPYFSQYKIKVIEENNNESVVSLEVPRYRKNEEKHDIVIVREFSKSPDTR